MFLDHNITFSYGPSISSKDLFIFEDETSYLIMNGASLCTTPTGINFTKGNIIINQDSIFSAETESEPRTNYCGGITIGNNLEDEDCNCTISYGSKLILSSGILNYKNILSSSLNLLNIQSALFIDTGARLNLYQNLDVSDGLIYFGSNSILGTFNDKKIFGSVFPQGNLMRISIEE